MSLNRFPKTVQLLYCACFDLAGICAWLSRVLVLLAAVEVVTMPLTQHIWTWDRFLHGGRDFELGLLMIVSCLCLVLLQAQRCRQLIGFLLTIRTHLLVVMRRREWSSLWQFGPFSVRLHDLLSTSPSGSRSLPLLI